MKIYQVEELVGITKKNIRFYEDQGLLCPNRNPQNDYREYSLDDVKVLEKINIPRCKQRGMLFSKGIAVRFHTFYFAPRGKV